jgi:hypothetical protein
MPARRTLLACLALPAPALAFRREELAGPAAEAYREGCRAASLHDAIRAEAAGLPAPLPPEAERALEAALRCPFCGCPVAGAPDHGEASPPGG